eukprot:4774550-Ditylum_brightwellii.AAC.1
MGNVNDDMESLDFKNQSCNCNVCAKRNGQYIFEGKYRAQHIVYKGKCRQANKNMSVLSTHMVLAKQWPDLPPNEKPSSDQISSKLSLEVFFQANPAST